MTRKKTLSMYLVAMIILSILFFNFANSSATATTSFEPRLTAPSYSNKYYYDGKYNIFENAGYGMPNCTAYAYGRAYEILGTQPNLCRYNAGEWWSWNINEGYYEYGQEPRVGAIACWDKYDNDNGHVAVVEAVSSTSITLSESAYGGFVFDTRVENIDDKNLGYSSNYRFLGYIYILEDDGTSPPLTTTPETPTVPEITIPEFWKVDADGGLNLRTSATTSAKSLTLIKNNSYIIISDTTYANGYLWGYTTYNGYSGWCAIDYADKFGVVGDTTGDGKFSMADILNMQKYLAMIKDLSSTAKILGDINQDGQITTIDIREAQKLFSIV